jgi:hypothetical protein
MHPRIRVATWDSGVRPRPSAEPGGPPVPVERAGGEVRTCERGRDGQRQPDLLHGHRAGVDDPAPQHPDHVVAGRDVQPAAGTSWETLRGLVNVPRPCRRISWEPPNVLALWLPL